MGLHPKGVIEGRGVEALGGHVLRSPHAYLVSVGGGGVVLFLVFSFESFFFTLAVMKHLAGLSSSFRLKATSALRLHLTVNWRTFVVA